MNDLLRFVLQHIDDEWDRLLHEFVQLTPEALAWQPDPNVHSAGWHVRHVIEWRYALVHVHDRPPAERGTTLLPGMGNRSRSEEAGGQSRSVV